MSIGVSVKVDLKGISDKVSPQTLLKAKRIVANQILMDTDKYVPRRSGDLRLSASIAINGSEVIWNTVYARAQFYGTNGIVTFNKYTTPQTGKKWMEVSEKANMNRWEKTAVKAIGVK